MEKNRETEIILRDAEESYRGQKLIRFTGGTYGGEKI